MTEEVLESIANSDGLSIKQNFAKVVIAAAAGYGAKVLAEKGFVKGVAIWTARAAKARTAS